jgi:hypothetical protein
MARGGGVETWMCGWCHINVTVECNAIAVIFAWTVGFVGGMCV